MQATADRELSPPAQTLIDAFRFHVRPLTDADQALTRRYAATGDIRSLVLLVQARTNPPATEAQIRALPLPHLPVLAQRLADSLETAMELAPFNQRYVKRTAPPMPRNRRQRRR